MAKENKRENKKVLLFFFFWAEVIVQVLKTNIWLGAKMSVWTEKTGKTHFPAKTSIKETIRKCHHCPVPLQSKHGKIFNSILISQWNECD